MDYMLKKQFILVTMRFKRIDLCSLQAMDLPQSELMVMAKAADGCCGGKGITVSDIHQNLYLSKPAVSQTLNNLERKGYIVRTIDSGDRRKITVVLTPTGEKVLAGAMRCYEEGLDSILEQLGTENVKQLLELTNRLMDIMDERKCKHEKERW